MDAQPVYTNNKTGFSVRSDKFKRYLLLAVSVLAAIAIIWQNDKRISSLPTNGVSEGEPDFFIVKGKYTLFNDRGTISSIMQSQEAKHYPDRNVALLTQPDLLLYREDNTPWRITAENGEYDLSLEKVELSNNVLLVRDERLATPWTLRTESLTLHNKSRFITTKQPVTISDSVSIMEGIGMNAWIDDKKIELTSNVRGNYAPQ